MNISKEKLDQMIAMVSKKLGTDESTLKSKINSGNLDGLLPEKDSKQLNQILKNKQLAEQLLKSPQAAELMKNMKKDN